MASKEKEQWLYSPIRSTRPRAFSRLWTRFRTSSWLDASLGGGGAYPPVNVFRKGDDFIIIAEVPGVKKTDLDVQIKGRTIRLAGAKSVGYPEKAALHRRERLRGPIHRVGEGRGEDQSPFTSIFLTGFWASGFFGKVTVSTPFLKLASILSASTVSGTRTERANEPKRRSLR